MLQKAVKNQKALLQKLECVCFTYTRQYNGYIYGTSPEGITRTGYQNDKRTIKQLATELS